MKKATSGSALFSRKTYTGFTIVELLIVVVVIAILAAISLVAYRGINDRAHSSAASSEASQAAKKVQLFYAENEAYPTSLAAAGITNTDALQYAYSNSGNPKTFCVTATSGNKSFKVDSASSNPSEGGCAGHGVGGVAAITNLAKDPRVLNSTSGITSNNSAIWTLTRAVTVPATPDGITSAAESKVASGVTSSSVLSVYNLDVLGNSSGITRSVSAWVRVNVTGYSVYTDGSFPVTSLPANTWVRVQTTTPRSGTGWSAITIRKNSGAAAESDRGWVTGIMATEGSQHYPFSDGNSPNWIWNGTPNASSSTGPAL